MPERERFLRQRDGKIDFGSVVFAGSPDVVNLTVGDGKIASIAGTTTTANWLCLPPLADLHVHANRAFTATDQRPVGLHDAARMVRSVLSSFTQADYYRHSCLLIETARRRGTSRMRTHADIAVETGTSAVAGSLQAAREFAESVDVEVVAFSGPGSDPVTRDGRTLLKNAMAMGAHLLGGAPAFCNDQKSTIDAILDLAVELEVPVDLHLDEHLDAEQSVSEYLATATIQRGLQGQVTLGHGCAISVLPDSDRVRVIEQLVEARITVIALPRTNLYLQDSGNHSPTLRGIAPVREMLAAGVPVRFASDNVRDVFYPYGDADLLGVAMDGVLGSHVDEPDALVAAICDGRHTLAVGDSADFVLVPGDSLDAVLADPPAERWVVQNGEPLRVDRPE